LVSEFYTARVAVVVPVFVPGQVRATLAAGFKQRCRKIA